MWVFLIRLEGPVCEFGSFFLGLKIRGKPGGSPGEARGEPGGARGEPGGSPGGARGYVFVGKRTKTEYFGFRDLQNRIQEVLFTLSGQTTEYNRLQGGRRPTKVCVHVRESIE